MNILWKQLCAILTPAQLGMIDHALDIEHALHGIDDMSATDSFTELRAAVKKAYRKVRLRDSRIENFSSATLE